METETGKVLAELTGAKNRATLVPARVAVTFGDLVWPDVEVKPGAVTTLKPGVIEVRRRGIYEYKVVSVGGVLAGTVRTGAEKLPVPPGAYVVELDGKKVPVEVEEGREVEIEAE